MGRRVGEQEDNIECRKGRRFKLHQSYEEKGSTKSVYCKRCGGDKFYVGWGHHFEVMVCIKCKIEVCVEE